MVRLRYSEPAIVHFAELFLMLFPWGDKMLVHPRVTPGDMWSWLCEVYLSQADIKDCYLVGGKLIHFLAEQPMI